MTNWKHRVLIIPKGPGTSANPDGIARTMEDRMDAVPDFELVQAVESDGEWFLFMKRPAG